MSIRIVSVNSGRAENIGTLHGKPVTSAIRKTPIDTKKISVTELGVTGDRQVDQSLKDNGSPMHDGALQAVYFYPWSHYLYWTQVLHMELLPGSFGENFTVDGLTEDIVRIGDILTYGDVVFEVTKPRQPCYKLGMLYPRLSVPKKMIQTRFCGWYAKVVQPGFVPNCGNISRFAGENSGVTVLEAFCAKELDTKPIPGPRQLAGK